MNRINVTRSSMPDYEEYCREIKPLWESRILTNMGEYHQSERNRLCCVITVSKDFYGKFEEPKDENDMI